MKSLMIFLKAFLQDIGKASSISTVRDIKTITDRVENEGFSFLTITLPNFAKDFERSLELGYIESNTFLGFKRSAGLPTFLSGFLSRVFDPKDGLLLDNPDIRSIYSIRQICYLFKKVDLPCTEVRRRKAISQFIKCDEEVRQLQNTIDPSLLAEFEAMANLLFKDVFLSLDKATYHGNILPKHGSGATAEKLSSNGKYTQSEWTERLESLFPSLEYVFPNYGWYSTEEYQSLDILPPVRERPVRVVDVPKTLKTPRIIAIEPAAMQYVQQGYLEAIMKEFRKDDNSRNFVCFDSQEPNQSLALEGSRDGTLATLDLKEASDRVSGLHVRTMLARYPLLQEGVWACRSTKADVSGKIINLAKFASMGSALCFPMEAMVFCTLVFVGISRSLNKPLTEKDIKSFYGKVRVYGDDIIVPVEYASSVVHTLHQHGLVVNTTKSFWNGKFRESCGKDYYSGHDVSVVKAGKVLPSQRRDALEIVSWSELRNRLAKAKWVEYSRSIAYLDNYIGGLVPYPYVAENAAILGRIEPSSVIAEKFHSTLHIPLVKGVMLVGRPREDQLSGFGALMKFFLRRGETPFEDKNHLMRSGRPVSVQLKNRWANPYGG